MTGRRITTLTNDEGDLLFDALATAQRHAPDEDAGKRIQRLRNKLRTADMFIIEDEDAA